MKLEELLPEKPKFKLKSTGKEYTLRIPNLEDRARFIEWTGSDSDAIAKVFTEMKWPILSKMIYRLLVEKEEFKAKTEKTIDDDGNDKELFVSGPEMLMRAVIGGQSEALSLAECLVTAIRRGDPIIDQAMNQVETKDKKKP